MKTLLAILLFVFSAPCFGQITNVKTGLWSDQTVWSSNKLPTATDDVILNFDIIVNTDAACQSLTLNGHNVTVSAGVHLNILGSGNTVLLSKYIELDTSRAAPFDTISIISLNYDNAKRNTVIDEIQFEEDHTVSFQSKSIFFYNGNDIVPFKKVVDMPVTKYGESLTDTCFYFYTNGLVTRDSTIEISSSAPYLTVNNYKYVDSGIIYSWTDYNTNPGTSYTYTDTIHLKYANGNIVGQIDTSHHFQEFYYYAYDDHPNPFYGTQAKIAAENHFPIYFSETYIEDVFARNNAVEINQIGEGGRSYHYKIAYEYNANGYPREVRGYDQNDPAPSGKAIYIYKN